MILVCLLGLSCIFTDYSNCLELRDPEIIHALNAASMF